jgi:hypothetical protein
MTAMIRRLVLAVPVAALFFSVSLNAAERRDNAIVIAVPVIPEVRRYLDLLAYPSYMAIALENNGLSPSQSSRLLIHDRANFETRNASIRFTGRKDAVFFYEAAVKFPIGGASTGIGVRVEVDASSVANGTMVLKMYPPLSGALPQSLLDRIEFKVQSLASAQSQRQMLAYLDEVRKRAPGTSPDSMLEPILLDAYARSGTLAAQGRDFGDAEPLSEQLALIATIAIWLVAITALVVRRFWRRRARPV